MDENYIRNLEVAYDSMVDKTITLENEKEQAVTSLHSNQEYLKDVIYCLADKLEESDRWQVLQDISKLGKRRLDHENQKADLIVAYVSQRLGFKREAVIKY
jgi:hypothetical protein